MAALTEKQRVSLTPGTWVAIGSALLAAAGAWYSTKADASQALAEVRTTAGEVREHDRQIQEQKGEQKLVREILQRIERGLERVERKVDGRGGR